MSAAKIAIDGPLPQDEVDGRQERGGDGDDGLLGATLRPQALKLRRNSSRACAWPPVARRCRRAEPGAGRVENGRCVHSRPPHWREGRSCGLLSDERIHPRRLPRGRSARWQARLSTPPYPRHCSRDRERHIDAGAKRTQEVLLRSRESRERASSRTPSGSDGIVTARRSSRTKSRSGVGAVTSQTLPGSTYRREAWPAGTPRGPRGARLARLRAVPDWVA